jgi:DNA-directed RNA polymerase subunit RPC12/RpoP
MKCTKCGSKKTRTINLGQRLSGWGAAAITYVTVAPFADKGTAQGGARAACRNTCPTVEYRCLDCGHKFSKGPDM